MLEGSRLGNTDIDNIGMRDLKLFSRLRQLVTLAAALILLAACNATSINDGLAPPKLASANNQSAAGNSPTPSQTVGNETALAAQQETTPAQQAVTSQTQTPVQTAALDSSKAISFLPVEGAPQSAVTTLSNSLRESARRHGLTVALANQTQSKYRVKGYFSALNDGSGTLLIYIWDIIDANGKRLHRINGQERSGTEKPDPWQAITNTELQRVADATAGSLKSWLNNN